jgi:hypothetical protein
MKKIYESPLNGWDESATRVHVYAIENDEEYWNFSDMSFWERCDYFGVHDDGGAFCVAPGALYHSYEFDYTTHHIIMHETVAYNV